MKIAFLSHLDLNLYFFRLPIMRKLLEMGHEVYAICPHGRFSSKLYEQGISIKNIEIIRNSLNPLNEIKTIVEIRKVILSINPDILHTFMHKPNIYGAFSKVPHLVQTVTGMGSFYINNDLKSRMIRNIIEISYKYTSNKADKIIFQNNDDRSYFVNKRIIPEKKAVVIRGSGVDTTFFKPIPPVKKVLKELGIDRAKPIVLMVARIIKDKGVREYIKAANILKDQATFLYAGEIDKGNPNSFVPEWGAVKYLGFKENIKDLLSITDIFVLPSYREGIPKTLLEAAAMGKPIVTTDTIGCREVVEDGKNGFLVPVGDSNILADKIKILIENETLRTKFGHYGREKVMKEFDVNLIVNEYLKLYNEIMGY